MRPNLPECTMDHPHQWEWRGEDLVCTHNPEHMKPFVQPDAMESYINQSWEWIPTRQAGSMAQLLDMKVRRALEEIKRDIMSANPILDALAKDPKLKAKARLTQDLYGHGRNRAALVSALRDLNNEDADTAY